MTAEQSHILVIDDDDRLRQLLVKYLSENGFVVVSARGAEDARSKLRGLQFDLIILDLMMPGESGIEFAVKFRRTSDVPILMLTAMAEADDRIAGLETGADDYLAKPFEPRELLLRLHNILKRLPKQKVEHIDVRLGDAIFYAGRGELQIRGETVRLTDIEVALLRVLATRSGEILSREELIELTGTTGGGRAVDVQVTRLRRKIERDPKLPRYLQTVRGRGYLLRPDE
ncbi:MAG: response regulator [Rhodospirillales bacterium]|nr:response regulator [Rhodospirillales bacterium]